MYLLSFRYSISINKFSSRPNSGSSAHTTYLSILSFFFQSSLPFNHPAIPLSLTFFLPSSLPLLSPSFLFLPPSSPFHYSSVSPHYLHLTSPPSFLSLPPPSLPPFIPLFPFTTFLSLSPSSLPSSLPLFLSPFPLTTYLPFPSLLPFSLPPPSLPPFIPLFPFTTYLPLPLPSSFLSLPPPFLLPFLFSSLPFPSLSTPPFPSILPFSLSLLPSFILPLSLPPSFLSLPPPLPLFFPSFHLTTYLPFLSPSLLPPSLPPSFRSPFLPPPFLSPSHQSQCISPRYCIFSFLFNVTKISQFLKIHSYSVIISFHIGFRVFFWTEVTLIRSSSSCSVTVFVLLVFRFSLRSNELSVTIPSMQ